jgi:site-specific DNA-methyltransferase (adenine-specific)
MIEPYYADDAVALYHGDALAVLAQLPGASVDALITDPPYSSGGMMRGERAQPGKHRKYSGTFTPAGEIQEFTGDSRDQRAYAYWCALWLAEALRVVKPGGVALLFTDWRQLPSTTDALQAGGWVWRGIVPWAKVAYRPQSGRFAAQCEYVAWGSAGSMPVDHAAPTFPGFFSANYPRDREHITQKPIEVMRELVKITPPGGVILDPFMGSGTTGTAAAIESRRFIGVELADHYAEVAERRIRSALGQAVGSGSQAAIDFGESA